MELLEKLKENNIYTTANLRQLAMEYGVTTTQIKKMLVNLYGEEWFIRPSVRKPTVKKEVKVLLSRPPQGQLLGYTQSADYLNKRLGGKWKTPASSLWFLLKSERIIPCQKEEHGKKTIYWFDTADLDQYISDKSWQNELRPGLSNDELQSIAIRHGLRQKTVKLAIKNLS